MVQSDRRTKKHLVEQFESVGDDKPVSSEHVAAYLDMSTAYSAYALHRHIGGLENPPKRYCDSDKHNDGNNADEANGYQ